MSCHFVDMDRNTVLLPHLFSKERDRDYEFTETLDFSIFWARKWKTAAVMLLLSLA